MKEFLEVFWKIFTEMSPFLVLGFFFSGVMHAFMPQGMIYRHLSGGGFKDVLKAAIFGVPVPLCSCSVIPVAEYMNREGASRGAVLSFITSAPTTGIDSIMATYSLLGPVITGLRVLAAFLGGVVSGLLVEIFTEGAKPKAQVMTCSICGCSGDEGHAHSLYDRVKDVFHFGFGVLVRDVRKWLLIGIVIGALLELYFPDRIVELLRQNNLEYISAFLVSVPMYVCATGSIPIAYALLGKGFSVGAVIIFLVAGPATNTATISFVRAKMGNKGMVIYIFSIVFVALLFALVGNFLFSGISVEKAISIQSQELHTVKVLSAFLLLILFLKP